MHWTIATIAGKFSDVAQAALGEAQVDWGAAHGIDHVACTLGYAATECADALAKVVGQVLLTTFTGNIPSGRLILILSPIAFEKHRESIESVFGPVEIPSQEQAFTIRTHGSQYLILGGGRVGALYGTYELLNRFGFHWIGPDDCEEVVPKILPEPLPQISVSQQPSFFVRGYWIFIPPTRNVPLRGGKRFLRWMARNRMNLWAYVDPDKAFCRKLGMMFIGGFHGDMARYVPPEKYLATHPEYYGLVDGKRRAEDMVGQDNLCLSNPVPRKIFAEKMIEDLISGDNKWVDLFNVIPADGGRWCECEDCKAAGTPTDLMLLLVHDCRQAVVRARAEGRLNRDVMIGTTAYMETKSPPTRALPDDFDHAGTLMTYYPIERCYAHAFNDHACTELNAILNDLFQGWTRARQTFFRGHLCIGEYYNVSKFVGLAIPFIKTMASDIPYFYESGARIFNYMHVVTSDWGTHSLTNMQLAAQLWNHKLDCNQWLDEFLQIRYGNIAREMRRFYSLLEQAMANVETLRHVASLSNSKHYLFHTLKVKGNPENPVKYFYSRHLQYESQYQPADDGPSLVKSIGLLDQAGYVLDDALLKCEDRSVKLRLIADSRRFHFTRNVLNFTYRMVRIRLLENQGATEAAQLEARYLRDIGEALRTEEVVTRNGCQDSNVIFQNGLLATYLSGPYKQIMAEYSLAIDPIEFDGVI